eukprot:7560520-Pyramimonas_sp.AAC.1
MRSDLHAAAAACLGHSDLLLDLAEPPWRLYTSEDKRREFLEIDFGENRAFVFAVRAAPPGLEVAGEEYVLRDLEVE